MERNVTIRQISTDLFLIIVNGEFSEDLFSPGTEGKMKYPMIATANRIMLKTPNSILHPKEVPMAVMIGKPMPIPSVDAAMDTAMALPCRLEGTRRIAYAETRGHRTPAEIPPISLDTTITLYESDIEMTKFENAKTMTRIIKSFFRSTGMVHVISGIVPTADAMA